MQATYDVVEDSTLVISLPFRCSEQTVTIDSWTVTFSDLEAGMYAAFFTLDYTYPNYQLTVAPTGIDIDYSVSIDAVFDGWYPADYESVSFTVNILNYVPPPAPLVSPDPEFDTEL